MPRPILTTLALLAATTFAPALAAAQDAPATRVDIRNDLLSGVAMNGAASTMLITQNMFAGGWKGKVEFSKARLSVFYTYSAATAVTVVFSCSADGTNYAQLTARDISGATSAVSKITDSLPTSAASHDFALEYDVRGCRSARWQLAGTGAAAGDLVTADLTLVAGN